MITVLYTCIPRQFSDELYRHYLGRLPLHLQERNSRYHRWQDRHANLFGKMLLLEGLKPYGFDAGCLHHLQYNLYDRPSLSGEIDFNISHSGDYVACAVAKGIRLGIDIEHMAPVAFENFDNVMTAAQWQTIHASEDPVKTFYTYWAIKESVIKADSRGLSIDLNQIHLQADRVLCEGTPWYIRMPLIDPDYCFCLASDNPAMNYHLQSHTFY